MAGFKYIAPALALAAGAVAQSSTATCGTSGSTTTLQNQGDATALATCQTYTGSIAIATGTTDNIQLDGVVEVTENLVADGASSITSFGATQLTTIGKRFRLNGLTILSTLSFPSLTSVGTIDWVTLPALQGLSFTEQVSMVDGVNIQDTQLSSLEGLNLEEVATMTIANNFFLQDITMQLGNVSNSLTFNSNGDELKVSFPNLIWANNMTINKAASVSVPSLASVNGSLGLNDGTFESFFAPNLTDIGGQLTFDNCISVSNLSFPQLTSIGGGLALTKNTALESITGFPDLKTIGGALLASGTFENFTLPSLTNIRGGFNFTSSQNITEVCDSFKSIAGPDKTIKGKFICKSSDATAALNNNSTGTDSGSSSTGSPSSAAHPMLIPGATGVLSLVAAIFGLL